MGAYRFPLKRRLRRSLAASSHRPVAAIIVFVSLWCQLGENPLILGPPCPNRSEYPGQKITPGGNSSNSHPIRPFTESFLTPSSYPFAPSSTREARIVSLKEGAPASLNEGGMAPQVLTMRLASKTAAVDFLVFKLALGRCCHRLTFAAFADR
jgi:hypothetical protein